ncbi:DMT family transporter [Cellulophaga baltica]|uniref:DMT family transporter n=1 Tax=Cellulophaga baltica TaxID=76594 RepID=UPI0021478FF2|nr:DMT family transporter [Cellulophaga baltica]MCR1025151.1 DMT family transporter [Cellulophaga baltica]
MKTQLIPILLAIIAGAVLPFQAVLNIQLGKTVQQPVFAAFASFVLGAIELFIYLIIIKFDFSTIILARNASPVVWLAGILGAFYVAAVIILAPKLGTALTFGLVVAGQMTISLILDHHGLLGLPVKQINWQRILGIIMLLLGVIIIRKY